MAGVDTHHGRAPDRRRHPVAAAAPALAAARPRRAAALAAHRHGRLRRGRPGRLPHGPRVRRRAGSSTTPTGCSRASSSTRRRATGSCRSRTPRRTTWCWPPRGVSSGSTTPWPASSRPCSSPARAGPLGREVARAWSPAPAPLPLAAASVAVGSVAVTYPDVAGWFDLVRNDSMAVARSRWPGAALCSRPQLGRPRAVVAAAVLVLAVMTKQTMAFPAAWGGRVGGAGPPPGGAGLPRHAGRGRAGRAGSAAAGDRRLVPAPRRRQPCGRRGGARRRTLGPRHDRRGGAVPGGHARPRHRRPGPRPG